MKTLHATYLLVHLTLLCATAAAQPGCPAVGVAPVTFQDVPSSAGAGSPENAQLNVAQAWTTNDLVRAVRISGRYEAVRPETYANETRLRVRVGPQVYDVAPFTQGAFVGALDMVDRVVTLTNPQPGSTFASIEVFETYDDGPGPDGRWTSLCFTYEPQLPTNPDLTTAAIAAIAPAASPYVSGDQVRITSSANPGNFPASTGLAFSASLTNVGGPASVEMVDDGTMGDVFAGDGVFSRVVTLVSVAAPTRQIMVRVEDAQGRSDTAPIVVTVAGSGSTGVPLTSQVLPIPECGTAEASLAYATGQIRWFRVNLPSVTAAPNSATWVDIFTAAVSTGGVGSTSLALFDSTGRLVASDNTDGPGSRSELSFGQTQPLHIEGPTGGVGANGRDGPLVGGTYWLAVGAAGMAPGASNWRVTSTGTATGQIALQINALGGTCPTAIGIAASVTQTLGQAGDRVEVRATVTAGRNPTSSYQLPGSGVTIDGAAIGTGVTALADDGLHGDGAAGDEVWGGEFTLPISAIGTYSLPVTVRDDTGRTAVQQVTVSVVGCGRWNPSTASPGVTGQVKSLVEWDPDGAGPAARVLVAGGLYARPGGGPADFVNLGAWNGRTWSRIGGAFDQVVNALAIDRDGALIAAGNFTMNGTTPVARIARWDGVAWQPFGSGLNGEVLSVLPLPNGDLIAGGAFSVAGGQPVANIARWNGSAWVGLGQGTNGAVRTLARTVAGEILAGGAFTNAGGTAALRIARWDGSAWSAMGAGFDGQVVTLLVRANGEILAGGGFAYTGTTRMDNLARWDGTAWQRVGPGQMDAAWVTSLLEDDDGTLIVSGSFTGVGETEALGIARWDGTSWSALGGGMYNGANSLTLGNDGRLYAGGAFADIGNMVANGLGVWDGTAWESIGDGFDSEIDAVLHLPNGDVIYGGGFSHIDGKRVDGVARWDGTQWHPMGAGLNRGVSSLARLPNGDIVAAGYFQTASDGTPTRRIARWDGVAWRTMGLGVAGSVHALAVTHNGLLYAAGDFDSAGDVLADNIAVWNGTFWAPVAGGLNAAVWDLAVMPNGDLMAGGWFTGTPGLNTSYVARWNGTAWSSLGSLPHDVYALKVLADGSLLVGGNMTVAGSAAVSRIARWNGTTWSALGSAIDLPVRAIAQLPNGDIVIGGDFTTASGRPVSRLARWNGTQWTPLTTGTNGNVSMLDIAVDGSLLVSGSFSVAGGKVSPYVATWTDGPTPLIEEGPAAQEARVGDLVNFSVEVEGTDVAGYRWRRDGVPLADGPTAQGSVVSGASTSTLSIARIGFGDAGRYDVVVSGGCNSSNSTSAFLTVLCPADLDNGTGEGTLDGAVDINDLLYFLVAFENGGEGADLDNDGEPTTGTPDGAVTIDDLLYFLVRFEAGC